MGALRTMTASALALGAVALGAAPAQADVPEPFTITEVINFDTGEATFTATGRLCGSGTFVDSPKATAAFKGSAGKLTLIFDTVYTCDDGSGTFSALKHVFITFNEDGTSTNTGPISLMGGTGDFVGIAGHGIDEGVAAGGIGIGSISGVLIRY